MSTPALAENRAMHSAAAIPVNDVKVKDSCMLFVVVLLATVALAVVGYQLGSSLYLSGGISAAVLGTAWIGCACSLYFFSSR